MQKNKVNRETAIETITDLLFIGKTRKEIIQDFTDKYEVSEASIDKWIKKAKPKVDERRQLEATEKEKLIKENTKQIAEKLGLTLEKILSEYQKIAFSDIRNVFDDNGKIKKIKDIDEQTSAAISSIEIEDITVGRGESATSIGETVKIKRWDKKGALDSICRILGLNAPDKVAPTDPDGNPLPQTSGPQIIVNPIITPTPISEQTSEDN